jgi:ABC-type multidrug transport system fused ATPase/permease subunit
MMALHLEIKQLRRTTFFRSIEILSRNEKTKVLVIMAFQAFTTLLDLIGIALIGILGALTISGMQSKSQAGFVAEALRFMSIEDLSLQVQAVVIGSLAGCALVTKTLLSIFFTRKALFFLSRCGARISSDLLSRVLSLPYLDMKKRTSQDMLYSLTSGVQTIILGFLGQFTILASDVTLLALLGLTLILVDPLLAVLTIVIFVSIGLSLYFLMHRKAMRLGRTSADLNILSNEKIIEVLFTFRESLVKNRRGHYASEVRQMRNSLADTVAEMTFLPNLSKYIVESSVIVGSLIIGGIQFALKDAFQAIATLTLFMAAGSRIAPAVLRVQQGAIAIKSSLGAAGPTLELIDSLVDTPATTPKAQSFSDKHDGFVPNILVDSISYTYPGENLATLQDIQLSLLPGEVLAVVGPSGAGKSTLVDLILGILSPDQGNVLISGLEPIEAFKRWPGAVAYVPQEVFIIDGSVRENITLGYLDDSINDLQVNQVVKMAALDGYVDSQPDGLSSQVGERGTLLSGGQRQRLGIARALITNPGILVLDEATSAMDGITEREISNAVNSLRGKTSIILIAHRLATVMDADKIVYLESGKVLGIGTFDEVRKKVKNFDIQARLMGL